MATANPLSTSTSLINQIRAGEQLAWQRVFDVYSPLIAHWCRRYGIRGADAEDIAQNVFIAVVKHIAQFGQERLGNSFRAWLWTITRSKIMDELRYTQKHPTALGGQISPNFALWTEIADSRTSSESAEDLKLLVASGLDIIRRDFSQQTWHAFWQTAAMGHLPSRVAEELGMTSAAVCMCRARVLRRLRETICDL